MKGIILAIFSFIFVIIIACCSPYSSDSTANANNYSKSYTIPEYTIPEYNLPKFQLPEQTTQFASNPTDNYSSTVYITRTGKCYHLPGCRYAKNTVGSMSKSDAKNSKYRACKHCFD